MQRAHANNIIRICQGRTVVCQHATSAALAAYPRMKTLNDRAIWKHHKKYFLTVHFCSALGRCLSGDAWKWESAT